MQEMTLGRKNSKQNQNARNESWEKEREPKREARSDAEGLTETGRSPRQKATRWREKAKPIGKRRVPSREVGEEPERSKAKRRPKPIGGAKQEPDVVFIFLRVKSGSFSSVQ